MDKCEKCLYKENCQFLATHKRTIIEGCTAFKSEAELRAEVAREIFEEIDKALERNYYDHPFEYYASYLRFQIANLKKKYTEGKDEEF